MFITTQDADLDTFKQFCETKTDIRDYPLASQSVKNILIYGGNSLRETLTHNRVKSLNEIHRALKDGPGVIVIRQFYPEPQLMDKGNEIFNKIIEQEKQQNQDKGDHFSKGSPNVRIWNALGKLLDADPEYFYDYFKNPLMSLISQAWLGPAYQITAQVNLVRPGSKSQVAHRDYHLGFLDDEVITRYPLTAQVMSQYLTLQGAVAHCDMPIESGPTLLLPHSQKYPQGYAAMRRQDFIDYFNSHAVQCELYKGDAVFFSPSLFHAAGENVSSNIDRMANLIQVSSSFGRPMEKVDWIHTAEKIYPALLEKIKALPSPEITLEMEAVIQTAVSGYPFPSDLDVMKPKHGSLTPASDQDVVKASLLDELSPQAFHKVLVENQV